MKEDWIVFTLNGKEICAYTVRGTFAGELSATRENLAFEKGVSVNDIKVSIVKR